jgi:HEAT repeat protein
MLYLAVAVAVAVAADPAAAGPAAPEHRPVISNARLETVSAAAGLQQAIRAAVARQREPGWIGYSVPRLADGGQSCCWDDGGRGCGLEGGRQVGAPAAVGPVLLEGPTHIVVLLRAEQGAVGKLRSYTSDCPLDGGGLPMLWLTDVRPSESVALLAAYANAETAPGRKSLADPALHALASQAAGEAAGVLEKLAESSPQEGLRKKALFWLATSRGERGYQVVSRLVRVDPSDKVREHAVFALAHSQAPGAVPAVITVARQDKSPRVRGQALFWLAQKASRVAAAAITEAIDRDPETEVKKKAVFALTQLPKDEGVPLLIQVARSSGNPAVRKQALFWLGESKDPRALKFFEDVLSR